ncbi:Putative Na+/H+ antiporter [Solimonas aquatica]|uniref:Putative Na+/H+ antiporter n=1 Tax=Solimonas aquatica TaxID=489703 RepID=A0A1H9GG33_9GAMM|nr:putative Na+/H+ antiporter [Solimonas aquatica]SEQ48788.1 Putative Na+/H+ antiporter [Solimonas aquatica]
MTPSLIEYVASALFAVALLHTFSTKFFERLAHAQPAHAGFWHLLGEVEVVFGLWAMVLVALMFVLLGSGEAIAYMESRNFTEPLFVFAIMVVAGSRPVLEAANSLVTLITRLLPLPAALSGYFCALAVVPLLGSFITEPGAMTLAALMLRERFLREELPARVKYLTVGVLFVNVSIGGVLTPYAAPPVLMVASTWGWDLGFMLQHFGWKAAIAVAVNAFGATLFARTALLQLPLQDKPRREAPPWPVTLVTLGLLSGIVVFAHHPALFLGLLLFFMGFAQAYRRHQGHLILRESLLVAFFLAGLVVLGGLQQWWLQPLLTSLSETAVYYAATALTAITDNAALTYLGSLVPGLSPEYQYALVAGAVTGGGLTVIANAPNPAGYAILRSRFEDEVIHPGKLLLAALAPTLVAIVAFRFL